MNIRRNNGITLVALVVTIIILLIISGISISGSIRGHEETVESKQITELTMIKHAILERYTRAQFTNEQLPGTAIEISEVQDIIDDINEISGANITLQGTNFRSLSKADLDNLGISGTEDIYIVEFSTGEVINSTIKTTKSNKALYTK